MSRIFQVALQLDFDNYCVVVCAVGLCGFLCVLPFSFLCCELVSSNPWDYLALFFSCRWGVVRLGGAVVCYGIGSPSFPFSVPCGGGFGYYVV